MLTNAFRGHVSDDELQLAVETFRSTIEGAFVKRLDRRQRDRQLRFVLARLWSSGSGLRAEHASVVGGLLRVEWDGILSAMKRIGLLGGMSWESSAEYYRLINEATRERLGGLHSADCVLRSVDFADIEEMQSAGSWEEAGELLAAEARSLVAAGAELLVLCTNTMHKVSAAIVAAVEIPFLHIADATAEVIAGAGISTVGLVATAYTMEQDFYVGRLREQHGLEVLVPNEQDRRLVHEVIYDELCLGIINESSRTAYRDVICDLVERGARGVLLGCTEIGLLVGPQDAEVPLFDTARLHAQRAVEFALT